MHLGAPKKHTAQGAIHDTDAVVPLTVVLTAGAGAGATATIREGGAGGTDVLELAAPAGASSAPVSMMIRRPFLQAIGGAGASLTAFK